MNSSRDRFVWLVALAMFSIAGSGTAHAAGYAVAEQSARGLGSAFAGEAATAEDASTVFFNPAGMSRLAGTQIVAAGHVILPEAEFHDRGSQVNPLFGGAPLTGRDDDGASNAFVPSFYLSHELSPAWSVGFGVNAPFGLRTGYAPDWIGRYHAIQSLLTTYNLNPSVSYSVGRAAIGVGFDAQYALARLTNAVDLGSVCLGAEATGQVPRGACTLLMLAPQNADGFAKVKGEDWGFGFNLGVLWEPVDGTRVGLAYRSRVEHTLDGEAKFRVPDKAAALKLSGALVTTDATAVVTFPDLVSLSFRHDFSPAVALLADATWTNWSLFRELRVDFQNPNQPAVTEPENWNDTWRLALGGILHVLPALGLRAGFAWDQSPVPNGAHRTPRIPDADRFWLTTGLGYQVLESLRIAAGYAHIFSQDPKTNNADPSTGNILHGHFSAGANIVGVQASWRIW